MDPKFRSPGMPRLPKRFGATTLVFLAAVFVAFFPHRAASRSQTAGGQSPQPAPMPASIRLTSTCTPTLTRAIQMRESKWL